MTQLAASPMLLLELAIAVGAGTIALTVFLRWERAGRRELAVAVLGGAILGQLAFYPVEENVPVGIFRPGPLRLPELIIGAAVIARLLTARRPPRPTAAGIAWLAFFAWYLASAAIGRYNGNASNLVLFNGKFIVYVGGSYILAAGVPIRRLVSREAMGAWIYGVGAVTAAQILVSLTDHTLPVDSVGADAGSVYLGLGVVVLLVEGARRPARLPLVVAAVPLVIAPLVTNQRASVVHAAVSVTVLAIVAVGRTWSRRMSVRPTQLLLGAAAGLAVMSFVVLPNLSTGQAVPHAVSSAVDKTFGGLGNEQSAQARVNQYESARTLIVEQPLIGEGLGGEHTYWKPGIWATGEFQTANVFDNALLDLLVRSGIVGALLFAIALAMSGRDAWRVWIRADDPRVAAFGLAALTFIVGVAAKGLVESILEKGTVACALGLFAGAVASATRYVARPGEYEADGGYGSYDEYRSHDAHVPVRSADASNGYLEDRPWS